MNFADKYLKLKTILNQSTKIKSFDRKTDTEADALSHSILDIEESCNEITNNLISKLYAKNITENDINEILLDIGEELRHIIYHTNNTKYFKYLSEIDSFIEEDQ